MRMKFQKSGLTVCLVVTSLSGWAGSPEIKESPFNDGPRFKYVIPKDARTSERTRLLGGIDFIYSEEKKEYKKNLGFGGILPINLNNKSIFRSKSFAPIQTEKHLKVQSCIGSDYSTGFHGNCDGYNLRVNRTDTKDSVIIELVPYARWNSKRKNALGIPYEIPEFPPSELKEFLSTVSVQVKYEIDSPYKKEAILANFKRIMGYSVPSDAAKRIMIDPSHDGVHNIYKGDAYPGFFMSLDKNSEGMAHVGVQPYRDGSKVVMTVVVLAWNIRPGEPIDLKTRIDQVKSKLHSIVTN